MTDPEDMLLGCLMQSPHTHFLAVECGVTDESFTRIERKVLWQTITGIITRTGSVDRYSIISSLTNKGHKSAVELVDTIPVDVNPDTISVHIEAVRNAEKVFKLQTVVERYTAGDTEIDERITALATDAMGILHNTAKHKVNQIGEVIPSVRQGLIDIQAGHGEETVGFPSFIGAVNTWGVAYPRGKIAVVAGPRGFGKSTIMKQEILHHAHKGTNVGLVTMEDTANDVVTNTVSIHGAGFMWKYQRGIGSMDTFDEHADQIKDLPIYMIDSPQTISDLEASITLLTTKYKCDMIFTDHLHEILSDRGARYGGIDDRYTDFMERLVAVTKRLNIAHVLYAQFSRDCEKENRKPLMRDLKGSSAIEQKARRIYMLYKDPDSPEGLTYEGTKFSNSGYGSKDDRVVRLKYAETHDGFIET